jgi:hypothetical protein
MIWRFVFFVSRNGLRYFNRTFSNIPVRQNGPCLMKHPRILPWALKDLKDSLTDVGDFLTDALHVNLGCRAFRDPIS